LRLPSLGEHEWRLWRSIAAAGPRAILWIGIVIRVLTFIVLSPDNDDQHSAILKFILQFHRLPHALDGPNEAYSPPLYYLLASPLLALFKSTKGAQILSLALSIGTLLILHRLIYHSGIIQSQRGKFYAFLVAAILPAFIIDALYVSNDALAIFLGALSLLQAHRLAESPDWKQLVLLAILTGLGLLTKAVFLAFIPCYLVLVCMAFRPRPWKETARRAAVFLILAVALGSYKFVDNFLCYGDPFVSNLDIRPMPPWVLQQQSSYKGWRSYADFDVARLVTAPRPFSGQNNGSYPVLLYGTFWYPFWYQRMNRFGSLIYLLAPLPAGVFLIGLIALARRAPKAFQAISRREASGVTLAALTTTYVSLAVFLANLALLLGSVAKYHVWSIMNSRLLFPALFGALVAFAAGAELLGRWRLPKFALAGVGLLLAGLLLGRLSVDVGMADPLLSMLRNGQ
jgi:4-amino-4-deoxy-L-arabinose transferase-like glycosyltransferase